MLCTACIMNAAIKGLKYKEAVVLSCKLLHEQTWLSNTPAKTIRSKNDTDRGRQKIPLHYWPHIAWMDSMHMKLISKWLPWPCIIFWCSRYPTYDITASHFSLIIFYCMSNAVQLILWFLARKIMESSMLKRTIESCLGFKIILMQKFLLRYRDTWMHGYHGNYNEHMNLWCNPFPF